MRSAMSERFMLISAGFIQVYSGINPLAGSLLQVNRVTFYCQQ